MVGGVEVVGFGRKLGRQRVNLLDDGQHAQGLAAGAHQQLVGLHVALAQQLHGNLLVGETGAFHVAQQLGFQRVEAVGAAGGQLVAQLENGEQALQKPQVNLGQLVDLLDGVAGLEGVVDGEDALLVRLAQQLVDGGVIQVGLGAVGHEAALAGVQHAQAFLHGFLERFADGHHLADALHGRANLPVHALELAQVPARQLHHHVVERRLKKGRVVCVTLFFSSASE